MAYSTNPNLPKARATAMRLLVVDQLPVMVVARKCGVHRSTIGAGSRNGMLSSVCPDGQWQPSEQASQDKERYLLLSISCLSLEYTNRFVSSTHKSSRNLGHHSAYCVSSAHAAAALC